MLTASALEELAKRAEESCIPACYSCERCQSARDFLRGPNAKLLAAALAVLESIEDEETGNDILEGMTFVNLSTKALERFRAEAGR